MDRRTFPLQRWLNVILRGLHLVAVILLGAGLLGAVVDTDKAVLGVAATGLAMLVLDTWSKPSHLREASGISLLIKLALVAWMAFDETSRLSLFWIIVAGSAIFAHAPAKFRHAILIGRQ
jgi:hypothetical protein